MFLCLEADTSLRPSMPFRPTFRSKTCSPCGTPWEDLLRESHDYRRQTLHAAQRRKELQNIRLEPWHCVGPFKEGLFANVTEIFGRPHGPEAEVLASRRDQPDFSRAFTVERLPGMQTNQRHWTQHPDWTDGYRHLFRQPNAPNWNWSYANGTAARPQFAS